MLGWQAWWHAVRPQLGCHAAFATHAPADLDDLIGSQFGEPEPAQRLHMDKDIRSAFATCQKSKSANPIEPFDPGPLPIAFCRDLHVRALRQLRWVDWGALVHAEHAKGLQAPGPFENLAVDPRTLIGGLIASSPETGDVQQDVGKPIVRHNEPISLRDVEPLDRSCDLEDFHTGIAARFDLAFLTLDIRIVWRKFFFLLHHTGTPRFTLHYSRQLLPKPPVYADPERCPLEIVPLRRHCSLYPTSAEGASKF